MAGYEPFGAEWEAELKKSSKSAIIALLRRVYLDSIKQSTDECQHFYIGTDGVHPVLIDRCNHPDRKRWRAL